MKTKNKVLSLLLTGSALLVLGSGCKKLEDFGDTNVNPNVSTYAETYSLIASVESRLGSRTYAHNDAAASTLTGFFCQYFAEPTYPGSSRYTVPQVNGSNYYSSVLYDIQQVIDRNNNPATAVAAASSGSNASQLGIARILKAYIMWTITDCWGDMPYSEALKGLAIPNPKYDSQESIYKDLLKEVSEAVDQFDPAGVTVKGDLIYSGNVGKWQRFGNTLRMLMSLRLTKVYPNAGDYAAQQFSAAASHPAGFITSNSDNFQLAYPGNTLNFNNPWYGTGNSADLGVAQTFTDALIGFGDTRLSALASNSTGVPYGLNVAAPTNITFAKILAPQFKTTTGTFVFVSAASSLLAQAEAIQRGWITGDAKTAYNAGVTASFAQWGVTMPANYLTTGPANFDNGAGVASIGGATVAGSSAATPTALARINTQQWIAYYPIAIQGWSNWRRTGYPAIKPTIYPATSHTEIPRRLTYGTLDYSLNGAQVALAASAMGGDDQDSRMWWDRP